MEATGSKRTWKPTVAGILNIVSGGLSLVGIIITVIWVQAFNTGGGVQFLEDLWAELEVQGFSTDFLVVLLVVASIWSAVVGILSVIGGIYSLQRRKWGWALTGSIASVLGQMVLGVLAVIFVALSRDEFD